MKKGRKSVKLNKNKNVRIYFNNAVIYLAAT